MKTFHCNHCSHLVFYENVRCERCESLLGYVPEVAEISAFEDAGEGRWRSLHSDLQGALFRQCHNYAVENVCNWMIPADSPDTLCRACQLTLTIPNLSAPDNRLYWYRLEMAKRRLLYTLAALGLDVKSRQMDPEQGLAFEFLEDGGDGEQVMTGHDNGLITLNIAEADDAYREKVRSAMGEPYRTLLGHFRHETGHYYFSQLVQDNPRWLEPFRKLFGDESVDYGEALTAYYRDGAPARLAGVAYQRVRDDASVGRLGGDVGALHADRRRAGYVDVIRRRTAARRSERADADRPHAGGGRKFRESDEALVSAHLRAEQPEPQSGDGGRLSVHARRASGG
ncbi:hypothetical protein GGD41_003198 [Paraburkholderia bryophila]|uniref:Zinc-ribbon domain-containing protein n=1 Tax=Paraburkholderia bryophila TaxID=420952 RepID=A0A7Y9W835_9BURK|nr:hypothetical protein [Paraburkholderia bryophila]